jgi:hypothetical protein
MREIRQGNGRMEVGRQEVRERIEEQRLAVDVNATTETESERVNRRMEAGIEGLIVRKEAESERVNGRMEAGIEGMKGTSRAGCERVNGRTETVSGGGGVNGRKDRK